MGKNDRHTNSYSERQSGINVAEERFEKFCLENGWLFYNFGFDEKNNYVENFFCIPKFLRSLPDYLITKKGNKVVWFCEVKGTNKIKLQDLKQYNEFNNMFCTERCKLIIVLASDDKVKCYPIKQVNERAKVAKIHKYENDGKEYFKL